jgi:head-tail adaptor
MSVENFFTTGISYKAPIVTQDEGGGEVETLGSTVPLLGRIRPMTNREILASEKLNEVADSMLYCKPETNLTVKCRVYYQGVEYQVVSKPKDPMTYGRYWIVSLRTME